MGRIFVAFSKYLNFNISFFFFRGQKRISAEEVKIFIDYFRKHAGSKLCVDREGFRKLISTKNSDYYSERIFSLVDQNKDNRVCIDEYTEFMTKLSTDDQNGMIEFLFKIFDTDGRYLVCTAMHWYIYCGLSLNCARAGFAARRGTFSKS